MFHLLFLIVLIAPQSKSTPIPSTTETHLDRKNDTVNESIDSIAQHQTETIKKIVSDQQQTIQDTRETQLNDLTLEELKIRCQHIAKLFNITDNSFTHNKNDRIDQIAYTSKLSNHKPYIEKRPVYLQPNIITRVPMVQKTNGFYITTQPTSTTKKPTPAVALQHSIKYIRLEPVILQKTILNDGRTIYYWHRSLPTAVQLPNNSNDDKKPMENQKDLNKYEENTTPRTTSTTASSYYDFRSFFPSFYSSGQEISPTTTTTTVATPIQITTTTESPKDELLYGHQLRFVVPVPYDMGDKATLKHPMAFDQFAYYPKVLQPSTVNVQVPYTPTFHMIKTLAIPNEYINNDGTNNSGGRTE